MLSWKLSAFEAVWQRCWQEMVELAREGSKSLQWIWGCCFNQRKGSGSTSQKQGGSVGSVAVEEEGGWWWLNFGSSNKRTTPLRCRRQQSFAKCLVMNNYSKFQKGKLIKISSIANPSRSCLGKIAVPKFKLLNSVPPLIVTSLEEQQRPHT